MSGRFPPQWLDDLRSRSDIVEIVGSYVPLKKNGHRYAGLCPFHHETAPSFYVDSQKQVYHCFGCKAGGSVIQFVMDIERMEFVDAVKFLAERARMPLPEMQNDPGYEARRSLKERVYLANKAAARLYHSLLWKPEGAQVLAYLQNRGLDDTVIRRFGLGAAPPGADVGRELIKQGFTEQELIAAGLMMRKEGPAFDMFRNRALFPIIDAYGNVLGFGGRALTNEQMPKYLNTGDTVVFNKRFNVFAANLLRKCRGLSRVILVEGYMDVVALSQYGVEGVAATLGTALTVDQAHLLKRFAPEVYLSYDGDKAGQKAILRGLDILEEAGVPCRVLDFPGGLDPDEYIRQEGLESFQALKPISGAEYRMRREKEKHDLSTQEGRTEYAKACALILRKVREPVELDNYLKKLALETGFSQDVLAQQVGAPRQENPARAQGFKPTYRKRIPESSAGRAQVLLLALMISGKLPPDTIQVELFTDPLQRSLAEHLKNGESLASFMETLPDEESRQAVSTILEAVPDEPDDVLMTMASDAMQSLKDEFLQKRMDASQLSLEEAMRLSMQLPTYEDPSGHGKE